MVPACYAVYAQVMIALKRLLSRFKRKPEASGVSIAILQKRLERYSDDRLNAAMSRALSRKYDDRSFFALSIFDGDGAVIKIDRLIIGVQHFDRRIDGACLGANELPAWAEHSAHSVIEFKCPGGLPEVDQRETVYGLLGLLCSELIDTNVTGLVFVDEQVIVPNRSSTLKGLRSYRPLNPKTLLLDESK